MRSLFHLRLNSNTGFPLLLRIVVLVVAFQVSGAVSPVLQVVGWTVMLGEAIGNSPLLVAVEQTFSGKQPCARCQAAQRELGDEHQDSGQLPQVEERKPMLGIASYKHWMKPNRKLLGVIPIACTLTFDLRVPPLTPPPRTVQLA